MGRAAGGIPDNLGRVPAPHLCDRGRCETILARVGGGCATILARAGDRASGITMGGGRAAGARRARRGCRPRLDVPRAPDVRITPDEPGQLAIARFVSGLPRWNMFDHSTWRPLYGTLIAPLHWVIDDPTRFYEAAHLVNALLGGVAAALTYLLARRLTDLAPLWSAAVASSCRSPRPSCSPPTTYGPNRWSPSSTPAPSSPCCGSTTRPRSATACCSPCCRWPAPHPHPRLLPMAMVSASIVRVRGRRRLPLHHGTVVLARPSSGSTWPARGTPSSWSTASGSSPARNSYGGVADQLTREARCSCRWPVSCGISWSREPGLLRMRVVATFPGRLADARVATSPRSSRLRGPSAADARACCWWWVRARPSRSCS